jgi:hypothetical protein
VLGVDLVEEDYYGGVFGSVLGDIWMWKCIHKGVMDCLVG